MIEMKAGMNDTAAVRVRLFSSDGKCRHDGMEMFDLPCVPQVIVLPVCSGQKCFHVTGGPPVFEMPTPSFSTERYEFVGKHNGVFVYMEFDGAG